MTVRSEILNRSVEIAALFGHLSRNIFNTLLVPSSERLQRLRWAELNASGMFNPQQSFGNLEYLSLSPDGRALARSEGLRPVAPTKTEMLNHDEIVIHFALSLEHRELIKSWIPEIQLKQRNSPVGLIYKGKHSRKYPDLIFSLNVPGPEKKCALEIEMTQKSRSRYLKLLRAYASMSDLYAIIFVSKTPATIHAVKEALFETRFPTDRINVLFGRSDEISKNPADAILSSQKRNWTLNTIVQTNQEWARTV